MYATSASSELPTFRREYSALLDVLFYTNIWTVSGGRQNIPADR